eukprot:scaffold59810_cov100-Phaeocystis_antarctica.AAC.2
MSPAPPPPPPVFVPPVVHATLFPWPAPMPSWSQCRPIRAVSTARSIAEPHSPFRGTAQGYRARHTAVRSARWRRVGNTLITAEVSHSPGKGSASQMHHRWCQRN